MNFYENLFNMIEPFFSNHVFATASWFPLALYCGIYFAKSGGSHDFLSSLTCRVCQLCDLLLHAVIHVCQTQLRHFPPSLSKWDLVSSDSPPGVKAHYGAKWKRENEPNQMKAWNFLSFPIKSSPLGYPGLKERGNRSTPRQALGEEENSSYKNPELRSCHICVLKAVQSSPLAVHQ